jgi:hypothetical protein
MFAPAIKSYCSILLDRILPVFADPEAEQERAAEEAMASMAGWNEDYDGASEAAYEYGIEQGMMFWEMRTVFLATGVSGLYHLFEKQLYRQLNHELGQWSDHIVSDWKEASDIIALFSEAHCKGPTLQQAFSDPDLRELVDVANAVKHGDNGRAMRRLRKNKAVVVNPARVQEDWTTGRFSILGVSLVVLPEDVIRYRDAVLRFWELDGTFLCPEDGDVKH